MDFARAYAAFLSAIFLNLLYAAIDSVHPFVAGGYLQSIAKIA